MEIKTLFLLLIFARESISAPISEATQQLNLGNKLSLSEKISLF